MPCSPHCRTSRGAQSVSRCMFTCPWWMLSTICMALFLLFSYDTAKYVLCVTSLSPHAHGFVYLTVLDFWHQFCTQWCTALYISYIVAHVKAGCKPVSHFFSLWKPRNERNYASNKKSGLRGKRSAAPLKWPTVMKELNKISLTLSHKSVLLVTTITICVLSLTSTPLSTVAQSIQGSQRPGSAVLQSSSVSWSGSVSRQRDDGSNLSSPSTNRYTTPLNRK